MTEVLLRDVRGELARRRRRPGQEGQFSYRAGYLPEERRKIEAALFNNELLGVISTNALELGIDVGSLDAAVIVGYPEPSPPPGSRRVAPDGARASRRRCSSVTNAPIDQYLMTTRSTSSGARREHAVLDRGNPHILLSHLRCAAFEIPLSRKEEPEFGGLTPGILDLLEEHKHLREIRGRWYYTARTTRRPPSRCGTPRRTPTRFSTPPPRADGGDEQGKNRVIGTVDEGSAFWQVHPQAVYMHDGETYFVDKLDLSERTDLRPQGRPRLLHAGGFRHACGRRGRQTWKRPGAARKSASGRARCWTS